MELVFDLVHKAHNNHLTLQAICGSHRMAFIARLAQSAKRKALDLVVVGSSPTVGV